MDWLALMLNGLALAWLAGISLAALVGIAITVRDTVAAQRQLQ